MTISTQFRWLPDEEAWLESRIIANHGISDTTDRIWIQGLIEDFKAQFPCVLRTQKTGRRETEREMMMRWAEIPRMVKKWIQNHQHTILSRHQRKQPQASTIRSLKHVKRSRKKSARDLAKANDPELKSRRAELQAQLNAGNITRSEMATEINRMATQLLQDVEKREFYAEQASRQADAGSPRFSCETMPIGPDPLHGELPVFALDEIIFYRPPSSSEADHTSIHEDDTTMQFVEEPAFHNARDTTDVPSHVIDPLPPDPQPSRVLQAALIPSRPPTASEDVPTCLDQIVSTSSSVLAHVNAFSTNDSQWTPPLSDDLQRSPCNQSEKAYRTYPAMEPPLHLPPSTEACSHSPCVPTDSFTGSWSLRQTLILLVLGYRPNRDVRSVALSCHGDFVVCGFRNGMLQTFDTRTKSCISEMSPGHSDCVSSIAVSSDHKNIASGSYDGTMRIWDTVSGALLFVPSESHIDAVNIVAFSPCGHKVVSCSSTSMTGPKIWDLSSGALLATIDFLELLTSYRLEHVAFTLDGGYLIGITSNADVLHWEAETGILQMGESGECSTVWTVNSGSRHTISSCENGSILGWNIPDFASRSPSPLLAISQGRKHVAEWSLCDDIIRVYERDSIVEEDHEVLESRRRSLSLENAAVDPKALTPGKVILGLAIACHAPPASIFPVIPFSSPLTLFVS
ncbi:WD40 repeat-like protein [Stereum hirsutum FP-91666 SS1]|uniref:WD40 repeat-like protein n=1 Tax=Stereum hirsutum (strain FP-91666) TaxID=721885 RepID=UPI0004410480|nr:WD40 repeat-like protein [Stereum hirsutum FP-91666 SS1]EIM92832.1 WD40 repeat-like protein [Stereum hirsutum FP-91666 SS1]